MILNIISKNVHIDKKLQNILLKKYSNILNYNLKKNINNFFFTNFLMNFPVKKKLYTVLSSPHINKKAREQFIMVKHVKGLQFNINNHYNNLIYNYLYLYHNYKLNLLFKNYYNNIYLKNFYKISLNKFKKTKRVSINILYKI